MLINLYHVLHKGSMKAKNTTKERFLIEGTTALIKRLGYANAVRFISILGGKGDMVEEIRKRRESESIEDIVKRIRSKTGS
ncbi:Uncharacterised protein [uncultured archaeon]|nr:Uncharacterised protein [uncultured archaeon]